MQSLTRQETKKRIANVLEAALKQGDETVWHVQRELCRADLWFLLVYVLNRPDCDCDWVWERCREVQMEPDGYLDLWFRGGYKSTIITYALTIQDILRDPNITVGIFSFNRPIAKAFLAQIKREFEGNEELKTLFPDILWEKPHVQAPRWSEDTGIIVKRSSNPKESTIEAWGLVDSQPTSRHYGLLVFDDAVTQDSVSSPEVITKVTRAWELSLNLAGRGARFRYIGTRYDYADTYRTILDRGAAVPRVYPAERDGKSVFLPEEKLAEMRKQMGPYTYGAQMLQNPVAGGAQTFREEWVQYWDADNLANLNLYILVDPANSKKKYSDYTAMFVVGVGADLNLYVADIVMDRLSLTERTARLFSLVRSYRPRMVGYERYGMQSDIDHIRERMAQENFRFPILELTGPTKKEDRISALVPFFEQGRVFLPRECWRNTADGEKDLVAVFLDQYRSFPYCRGHDDLLDCLANVTRMQMSPPSSSMSAQVRAFEEEDPYGLETETDFSW